METGKETMEQHGDDGSNQDRSPDSQGNTHGVSDLFMLNCYDIWSATPVPRECFEGLGQIRG